MPEPKHEDVAEPTDDGVPEAADEAAPEYLPEPDHTAEPIDEDGAESTAASAGRHRPAGRRGLSLSSLVLPATLLIAVIALALTAWALWRPSWLPSPPNTDSRVTDQPTAESTAPASFTDQQVSDAKARACGTFDTVSNAMAVQTQASLGQDPVALHAVAANARLAMVGGVQYLKERIDPATPAPLATAIRTYSDLLQDIAMHSLAGITADDPGQAQETRDIQATGAQIVDMCK